MKVIKAPEEYEMKKGDVICFLAGGISNCATWQDEVIDFLKYKEDKYNLDRLVIMNPRRESFSEDSSFEEVEEQIKWEFKWLSRCDIFSMYFCACESVQPICMYELGRNIHKMMIDCPSSYGERIIIGVEPGYKRERDVIIQCKLATGLNLVDKYASPERHAERILEEYINIIGTPKVIKPKQL